MKRDPNRSVLQAGKTVGWREIVGLPDFHIAQMRAKIDTGARTSALHAENQQQYTRDGKKWVRFRHPAVKQSLGQFLAAEIVDERKIKNTGGIPECRLIIRTTLVLGHRHWLIDLSLADRKNMEFDLILGRTAIRKKGTLIDPSRSYLMGEPSIVSSRTGSMDA